MVDNAVFESVLDVIVPVYNVAIHLTSPNNTVVSWECFALAHAVLFYASMRGLPFSVLRAVIVGMVAALGGWVGLMWVLAYALSLEMNAHERRQRELTIAVEAMKQSISDGFVPLNKNVHEQLHKVGDLVRIDTENCRTLKSLMFTALDDHKRLDNISDTLTLLRVELVKAREKKNGDVGSGKGKKTVRIVDST